NLSNRGRKERNSFWSPKRFRNSPGTDLKYPFSPCMPLPGGTQTHSLRFRSKERSTFASTPVSPEPAYSWPPNPAEKETESRCEPEPRSAPQFSGQTWGDCGRERNKTYPRRDPATLSHRHLGPCILELRRGPRQHTAWPSRRTRRSAPNNSCCW